jgi:hypothetical protein
MADAEDTAVAAFMADMPDEPQTPANPPKEAQAVEQAEAPQEEQVEAKAQPQEQQEEVETIEIDPEAPLFEQELEEDGKKVAQKLSLKELQQGYLRERDYRKKTMELARQRDELPKLVAKQGQELSESYTKRLAELQAVVVKAVAPELGNVDLNKLATEDPFEYVRISNRARQIQELLQSVQKEQEAESQRKQQETQKATNEKWQKSLEVLQRDIPDFGPAVVKRLIDAGEEWGFTQEEVSGWTDHRQIKMLHALLDKKSVEAKRPEVEKKVAVVTKTMKPGQTKPARTAVDEAKAKLKKTGRPEGTEALWESFLH